MRKLPAIASAVILAVASVGSTASARELTATYPGSADEETYRSIAAAIFNYFPSYTCEFAESTASTERDDKFRTKNRLDAGAPVISASCKFDDRVCFAKPGVDEICFAHGGLVVVDRMLLRAKDSRAKVELTYLLADDAGKGAGLGFAYMGLTKKETGWKVDEWRATGAIDFSAIP